MPRFPGIFGGSATSSARSSTHSLTQVSEESQLHDALEGCTYILKDDMVTAESRLSAHDSSFHKVNHLFHSFLLSQIEAFPFELLLAIYKLSTLKVRPCNSFIHAGCAQF
jgi:hypothetical protein